MKYWKQKGDKKISCKVSITLKKHVNFINEPQICCAGDMCKKLSCEIDGIVHLAVDF